MSNHPVLLIFLFAVFIAFAFSVDDDSVSSRLKHVLVSNWAASCEKGPDDMTRDFE